MVFIFLSIFKFNLNYSVNNTVALDLVYASILTKIYIQLMLDNRIISRDNINDNS